MPALAEAILFLASEQASWITGAILSVDGGVPFTIEMLMTIAATGALVIGAAEEAALVVFLFAVGEVLEGIAADKASDGIRALAPAGSKTALPGGLRQDA